MEKFNHALENESENKLAENALHEYTTEKQRIENRMAGLTSQIENLKDQIERGSKTPDPEWLSEKLTEQQKLKSYAAEYGMDDIDENNDITGRDAETQQAFDEYKKIKEEIEHIQHEIDEASPTLSPEEETRIEAEIDALQEEYNSLIPQLNKLEDIQKFN